MSELGLLTDRGYQNANEQLGDVKDRIRAARDDRKRFEPTWQHNLAFAAGKHYLKWDRSQRRLAMPPELAGRDLYTADVITEYRTTALGELASDDDRPELLLRRDDEPSENYQTVLNRAVEWGWDNEWQGDTVLEEARRLCVDVGTAAVRCRWDPNVGPVVQDAVPFQNGRPLLKLEEATQAVATAASSGQTLEFRPIRRGAIRWEPLSPFNLLVPPGVNHEMFFPWECVVRPALLADVIAEYGDVAGGLSEDTDIGSLLGLDLQAESMGSGYSPERADRRAGRLRDHVWLYTYLEKPTARYPNGRTVHLATNKLQVLRVDEQLPYEAPDGTYRSGIAYFHWWRVSGRFWSRGLVDVMKDIQRSFNKRRNQTHEIIDRGMPIVFVEQGSAATERQGIVAELVELKPNERQPVPFQGFGPGDWMWRDIDAMRDDLEHATGLRGPRLGDNPANVTTYGQLAILNENEQVKRQPIIREHKAAIGALIEDSVHDMRTYWGSERNLALAGDDDHADVQVFDATKIPAFFIVKVAKGAAKPRSQAAELKKIEDLWKGALESMAVASNPHEWVQWYKDSLEAGQALQLPAIHSDDQTDKAELENHLMLLGQPVPVQYYDPHDIHIQIHRGAQIEAELAGDQQVWGVIEEHVQEHIAIGAKQMAEIQALEPAVEPGMEPEPSEQQPQGV